jgi:aminoglycoside 6-adenylyltransferase
MLPPIPPSNDSGYWIKAPTKAQYDSYCNEFWWCLNNVAKGIVRGQLPYALRMYHETVHIELDKMLEWYIGIHTEFSVSAGMWGKYFERYLPPAYYERYGKTYAAYDELWPAVFCSCALFHDIAPAVGRYFGYAYCQNDEDNMLRYLHQMKNNEL